MRHAAPEHVAPALGSALAAARDVGVLGRDKEEEEEEQLAALVALCQQLCVSEEQRAELPAECMRQQLGAGGQLRRRGFPRCGVGKAFPAQPLYIGMFGSTVGKATEPVRGMRTGAQGLGRGLGRGQVQGVEGFVGA